MSSLLLAVLLLSAPATIEEAREQVSRDIIDKQIPKWFGTPWDFYGTSETPKEGEIACGYFVTTILRDAGFKVERNTLAQQASENIIKTLVPKSHIKRFSNKPVKDVLASVRKMGEGLYLVGLDNHVGFLVYEGDRLDFCHSNYLEPQEVLCRPAATDPALESKYRVVGKLLQDPMMQAWMKKSAIRTVK